MFVKINNYGHMVNVRHIVAVSLDGDIITKVFTVDNTEDPWIVEERYSEKLMAAIAKYEGVEMEDK